jgi:endogenous inhibitor of DNA gyrase (YacG/DUF329 family)
MMCMGCGRDYEQQVSTASNTLDFCSARCELKNTFPIESESSQTESVVEALRNRVSDLREARRASVK